MSRLSQGHLKTMLDYLGTSYSNIKTIWGCFEAIMGHLGAIRGPSWEVLSALRASWGRLGAILGVILGVILGILGPTWDQLGPS